MCVQMRAPASTVGSAAGLVSGDRAGHRCLPAAGAGVILVLVAIYSFMFIHLDSGLTGAVAEPQQYLKELLYSTLFLSMIILGPPTKLRK